METVNNADLHISRAGSADELAQHALSLFVQDSKKAIAQRGMFNVAISGGHTPTRFFELLVDGEHADEIAWDKVHIFWVDERCVDPDDKESNFGLASHTFIDKVDIPAENVHRMEGERCEYSKSMKDYEATIREVFGISAGEMPQFDLIMLGMGADGHIGSLFPNSYALYDTDDLVSAVYFMGEKLNRITLTHPVLCASVHLVILIAGSEKAEIVRDVLQGEPDEVKYPVHTLWPILDKVSWLIDADAAKHL